MMRRTFVAAVLACVLPVTAFAGSEVTSQAIIDHFTGGHLTSGGGAESASRGIVPAVGLGQDRSVFIGAAGFGPEADGSGADGSGAAAGAEVAVAPTGAAGAADPGAFDLLIEFGFDSAALGAESRRHLDAFVGALQSPALAEDRFLVEGHTDAVGPAAYNLELSQRRAAAVVDYLVGRGVDPARLTAHGVGEAQPRTADPADAANRRVETRLVR